MLLILRQNENLCSEAKGDVHSVPFCTGVLLFCETSPNHPPPPPFDASFSFVISSLPLVRRGTSFLLCIRLSTCRFWIFGLWIELQQLYLLSLQKLCLVGPPKLSYFVPLISTASGRFNYFQLHYLVNHLSIYLCIPVFTYLPRFIGLILLFFSSLITYNGFFSTPSSTPFATFSCSVTTFQ